MSKPRTKPARPAARPTKPTATKPKATKPKAAKPTATKPKAAKPTAAKPKAAKPKAAKPTATKPKAARPTAARPKATKPTATKPKAARPTAKKAAKPKAAKATKARATKLTAKPAARPKAKGSGPRATGRASKAASTPGADSVKLFNGAVAIDSKLDLAEDSGPVSPAYQYSLRIVVEAKGNKLWLSHDEERGWKDGDFSIKIHDKRLLPRDEYEALWQDLLRLGVFSAGVDLIGDEGRSRVGVSFNYLRARLGDHESSIDYRSADLARSKNAAQAALIDRVKALIAQSEEE